MTMNDGPITGEKYAKALTVAWDDGWSDALRSAAETMGVSLDTVIMFAAFNQLVLLNNTMALTRDAQTSEKRTRVLDAIYDEFCGDDEWKPDA